MAQAQTAMPRPARVATLPIVIMLAILLGFLPASPRAEDLQAKTAAALQSLLVPVHQAAADGDYAAALEKLEGLANEVTAQAAAGGISLARQQRIMGALELVRADLESLIREAAEAAAAVQASVDSHNAAEQAPVAPAPPSHLPAPAPAPAPAPPEADVEESKPEPGDKPGKGNPDGPRGKGKDK